MKESLSRMLGFGNNQNEQHEQVQELEIAKIKANPYQPRQHFDSMQLDELAKSIQEYGVIQPIIVRQTDEGYELVAGERRLRASQSLERQYIPAIVRSYSDRDSAELALIENLQRENLNYFEEAEGYKSLIKEFQLTQEDIAKRVGRSQSTIANKLRLLKLAPEVKENIYPELITERHSRALLKLTTVDLQLEALKEIYERELNVRDTDCLVEELLARENIEDPAKPAGKKILRIFKDMRIYVNTIKQAVSAIEGAGLDVKMKEIEHDDHIEVVITIPKTKK